MSEEQTLEQARQYAWDWFSYHAAQRTNMFNYFLAAAALLGAGYAAVIDKYAFVAGVIGLLGAAVSASFILMDGRNARLVRRGELVLEAVEGKLFAPTANDGTWLGRNDMPSGILRVDGSENPDASGAGVCGAFWRDFWWGKHRVHLRLVESALLVAFLTGGIAALGWPQLFEKTEPATAAQALEKVDASLRTIDATLKAQKQDGGD
jgi:hypothetical protein